MRYLLPALFFFTSLLPARADTIILVAGGNEDRTGIAATQAVLKEPFGTEFDATGNTWIVEMVSGNRLLKIDPAGVLHHVAGQLQPGLAGDGSPGLQAQFNGPHNLLVRPTGEILIGDTWNGRVRRFDPATGTVSTLPGWQAPTGKERGNGPYCISLSPDGGKLHIADLRQVHELDLASGQSRIVAGNGQKGIPPDGALATNAPLVDPRAVAMDRDGNLYILERNGHALRIVTPDGRIRTVVNASGKKGADGDGGPALQATLSGPKHLCIDRDGSVLIADAENHLIRRYLPASGRIERVAGTGKKGAAGVGGDPLQCELARPHGVTVHPVSGELFVTDSYNNRVLKIVRH